jgi:hypothetical protein
MKKKVSKTSKRIHFDKLNVTIEYKLAIKIILPNGYIVSILCFSNTINYNTIILLVLFKQN